MCGIMGVAGGNTKKYDSKIESMLFTLAKRGPDDRGILKFPHATLTQTRLSIIDLLGGKQPMKDNKKNIAITFNGEIYNYQELKLDLEKSGYIFTTKSDTEIILKAYQKYGSDCPKYLEGMFAFALWDEDRQILFCARDRFGEKPFFYTIDSSSNFVFASEIKAILASNTTKPEIDTDSLDSFLSLMYVPPNKTIYKNISTLPPATSLTFKNKKITLKKYWSLEKKPLTISYEEAKEETKRLLNLAVKKVMIADVEVGTMLSGGVDSTLVTALAQKHSPFSIKTFSVGYGDYINELPFAEEASKKIGTDHYTLQTTGEMLEELTQVSKYFDEPHADSANLAQYLVSRLASTKVKVALTGDGADELFMGYGWYFKHHHLSWRVNPLEKLHPRPYEDYIKLSQVFTPSEKKKLWKTSHPSINYIPEEIFHSKSSPLQKINDYDLMFYLPGQLLSKVDRMAMMNSLETRTPFLNHTLAEFVYNLPTEYKVNHSKGKIILKDILGEIMTPEFANRKKQGFGAPVKQWLKNKTFHDKITTLFITHEALTYQYLNADVIKKMIQKFYAGDDALFYKIWTLLNLELWLQNHS